MKENVITGEVKSMGIPDPILKASDKIHVHIKDTSAYCTFHMAVVSADMVETIVPPRNVKAADFTHFR